MTKWRVAYEGPPQRIELQQGGYLCPSCLQPIRADDAKLTIRADDAKLTWDIGKLKLECLDGETHRLSARDEQES